MRHNPLALPNWAKALYTGAHKRFRVIGARHGSKSAKAEPVFDMEGAARVAHALSASRSTTAEAAGNLRKFQRALAFRQIDHTRGKRDL